MNIQCFPDDILLNIFGYLTVKELCKYSRVCKAWRRIACDKTLWKHIDMTTCSSLNLRKVWKFYRTRLSDVLRSLKMNGYYNSKCGYEKQKKQLLSDALLEEISASCPFIEELYLYKFFLEKMSAKKLPASLIDLKLRDCGWPMGWLKGVLLPNLRSLDLGKTVRISNGEMNDIAQFSSLEELNLQGLYRVSDNGIKILAENLPNLKVLNIKETNVTDLAVHHICRHLKNLVSLDVGVSKITDSAIESICTSLFSLKILVVSSPKGPEISDIGVRTLCFSKIAQNITQLDLSSCSKIGASSIVDISDKLVNLEHLDVTWCNLQKFEDPSKLATLYNDLPKLISIKTKSGIIANPNC